MIKYFILDEHNALLLKLYAIKKLFSLTKFPYLSIIYLYFLHRSLRIHISPRQLMATLFITSQHKNIFMQKIKEKWLSWNY